MRVEYEGLGELQRDLKKVDTARIVGQSSRETTRKVAEDTRSDIQSMDIPQRSVAAAGVEATASVEGSGIRLDPANPIVRAAIFGTRTHWLWGTPTPASQLSRRVFRDWVGSEWSPEKDLYALSPAIDLNEIAEEWLDDMITAIGEAIDG